jgi:uncharacterized protein with HEPN domain
MIRDFADYVSDMLNSLKELEQFTAGMNFETFARDRKTINAVVRSLEVMGEAAKRIPEDIRTRHAAIPWKRIAGMREKLIHQYWGVDTEIVWTVIKEELPPIKPLIENVLRNLGEAEK